MFTKCNDVPTPPPLPKYDPKEEAPMWSVYRLWYNLPVDKGPEEWPVIATLPKSSSSPDWRGVIKDNVIELPMPEPYKFGHPENPKYMWFDTPDYADPFKKLGWALKYSVFTGLFVSALMGTRYSLKATMKNNIFLVSKYTVPWVAGCMAGGTAIITLANLRGNKDDRLNYLAGGIVAGSIIGRKHYTNAVRSVFICSLAAVTAKYQAETNAYFIPKFNFRNQSWSVSGMNAEHGLFSGDYRLGIRATNGNQGRDVRTFD